MKKSVVLVSAESLLSRKTSFIRWFELSRALRFGFLAFALLAFANFARADFSGMWSGAAQLSQNGQKISDCSKAFLHFNQSIDNLETLGGEFNCSPLIIKSKPKNVVIREGVLYFQNIAVGTISELEIFSSYWDATAGWTHLFRLIKDEQSIQYFEQVTLKDGSEYYRIEGKLLKSE